MSTKTEEIVLPPGEKVPQDNVSVRKLKDSQITFDFKTPTTQPLQPLIQAKYNECALKVSAIVFIAASEDVDPESIFVTCQSVISGSGLPQLDLFIVYNAEEKKAKKFQGYRVDITLKDVPKKIEHVCAFLWDEDPRTSRGTVTRPSRVR